MTDTAEVAFPLAWVGMKGIDLPLTLAEPFLRHVVQARVGAHVDLPSPGIRGIHMSRGFRDEFGGASLADVGAVADWLYRHAALATPHSQRSQAKVEIALAANADTLGLVDMIDHVERVLGTPVQAAVKRADEQVFAALNGSNLMFVEDAAPPGEPASPRCCCLV